MLSKPSYCPPQSVDMSLGGRIACLHNMGQPPDLERDKMQVESEIETVVESPTVPVPPSQQVYPVETVFH